MIHYIHLAGIISVKIAEGNKLNWQLPAQSQEQNNQN